MTQIYLIIDQVPETYNVIKDWHRMEKDAYNKLWYDLVSYTYRDFRRLYPPSPRHPTPFKKAKIAFYIFFPFKHRRDKLNYALGLKPALDQLARENILVDDNWDRIDDNYYSRVDKEYPRTEIIIQDVFQSNKQPTELSNARKK